MTIWTFVDYNTHPDHGQYTRWYYLGKHLAKLGHQVRVFAGSHPHNSDVQLIPGKDAYCMYTDSPFPWILVHTLKYGRNRMIRIFSMFLYLWNALRAAAHYAKEERPDAVIGSSPHPLCNLLAIWLGRKYHCKAIVEVRDLWPESIVAYGIAGERHPAVLFLRWLEKWMYIKADAIIFTMEGAYDYIAERGWEKQIPRDKVFFVNNGVDLEEFLYNKNQYKVQDKDLNNPDDCKVIYMGTVTLIHDVGFILDVAKQVKDPRIRFLIWGDGSELAFLKLRTEKEQIQNVVWKGHVKKKYVPYIVSQADINFLHLPRKLFARDKTHDLSRFGISPNKLFDYFAAGKPILSDFGIQYHPGTESGAVYTIRNPIAEEAASKIEEIAHMDLERYRKMCEAAGQEAKRYDFSNLARSVLDAVQGEHRAENVEQVTK